MKKTTPGICKFEKKVVSAFILIILMASSCINPKDKRRHEDLIPEKDFVSILSDIYIANGLLSLPNIRRNFAERDSVLNYIDVIESHGYSYEKMNNTMNYYFVSKPKKLIRIYDQITGTLSEREAAMQRDIIRLGIEASRKETRYNYYQFPDPSRKENPGTTVNVSSRGTYTLTLFVTIHPDDPSFNPHLSAWLVDADSVETGRKKWLPVLKYIKDGHPHQYFYSGRVEEKRPMIMKTILYDYDNNIEEWERNATIEILSSSFNVIQE